MLVIVRSSSESAARRGWVEGSSGGFLVSRGFVVAVCVSWRVVVFRVGLAVATRVGVWLRFLGGRCGVAACLLQSVMVLLQIVMVVLQTVMGLLQTVGNMLHAVRTCRGCLCVWMSLHSLQNADLV